MASFTAYLSGLSDSQVERLYARMYNRLDGRPLRWKFGRNAWDLNTMRAGWRNVFRVILAEKRARALAARNAEWLAAI